MANPERFGRFWLHELIGKGGMADVFRASLGDDPANASFDFALKRMHEDLAADPSHLEMFFIEEYVQRMLSHPNVVRFYESGKVDDRPYLAMEYVRGTDLATLRTLLRARGLKLPVDLAIHIAMQLLRALDYVHRLTSPAQKPMELVHRDVSPANVLLGYDGSVKLGDFGVVRVNILERADSLWVKGKVAYVPPEVLIGAQGTQAWDLYSLGVCLFEMLTGRRLHGELSEDEIVEHAGLGKAPATDIGPEHDKRLRRIVADAIHQKPQKRFADAQSFYRELKAFAQAAGLAPEQENLARFILAVTGNLTRMANVASGELRDWLTGAVSERHLLETLRVEIERARRYGRVLSVISFDLDDFDEVHERLGRALCDELLSRLVETFFPDIAGLRSCDLVARRAGDRFCVLLPETPAAGAEIAADRVRRALAGLSWEALDPRLETKLTASLGVASYPEHGQTVGALLEAADLALHEAKLGGKNRVVVASSERQSLRAAVAAGVATEEQNVRWAILQQSAKAARGVEQRLLLRLSEDELLRAYAPDLGGGLRVALQGKYDLESRIELELHLPGDASPHLVVARVCWTGKDGLVGLRFEAMPPELERRLRRLVLDLELASLS